MDKKDKLFLGYISYLVSSSLGLISEPGAYGPIRLLTAVERLSEILKEMKIGGDYVEELSSRIERDREQLLDRQDFLEEFLQAESIKLARILADL